MQKVNNCSYFAMSDKAFALLNSLGDDDKYHLST